METNASNGESDECQADDETLVADPVPTRAVAPMRSAVQAPSMASAVAAVEMAAQTIPLTPMAGYAIEH